MSDLHPRGYVYLIGAGPGDPGLITVKGRDCIAAADVVIYDYLANEALLAYAREDAELIYAGKVGGEHNRQQSEINELIVSQALQGRLVARLKGGDPFIFGRGGEECEALVAARIPFSVVPGVTAGIAAPAYAGIPLTHRDITTSVAFVTGHERPGKDESGIDWQRLSLGSGTVVFYMGVKSLGRICESLISHGRSPSTPVALIRWGTRPEQQVLEGTLSDIADRAASSGFKAPAITVVGEVVRLRQHLRWFDNRPLSGRRVLVTRAADQASEFARMLEERGAVVHECSTISIQPPEEPAELDSAIATLDRCHWLILTSVNAVRFFFDRLKAVGLDARALGSCRVCAVGPKTAAAIADRGILPDLIPDDSRAEGVVAALASIGVAGNRIIFPRGDRARELIPQQLTLLGAEVLSPVAYRNVIPDALPAQALAALTERRIDCVTFTSSSTVENLARLVGENRLIGLLEGVAVAAIGPVTAATCRELGLSVVIEPPQYTLAALTDEMVRYFTPQ